MATTRIEPESAAGALSGDPTFDRLEAQIALVRPAEQDEPASLQARQGRAAGRGRCHPGRRRHLDAPPAIPAALGALIVVLEGVQQLNQYQQNWSAYRSTCEALKHEKYLFLAHAGPYAGSEDRAAAARGPDRGPDLAGAREVGLCA